MSTTNRVLPLHEQRGRRDRRRRRTLALAAGEESRTRVLEHLADVLRELHADRAVVAWMDDLDPTVPHIYAGIDLLRDVPRATISRTALIEAWERGVPGFLDLGDGSSHTGSTASLTVVALGSDGMRAWFLAVEGPRRRVPLDAAAADRLAFVAGEVASTVLHPDRGPAFPAWAHAGLGASDTSADERRWSIRHRVLRLVQGVVAEGLQPEPDVLAERAALLRAELPGWSSDPEAELWARVVDLADVGDWARLPAALVAWGGYASDTGELPLAVDVYGAALGASAALGDTSIGAQATLMLGRAHRNRGEWDTSEMWYRRSIEIARADGLLAAEALALDGWSNTLRVRGRYPAARRQVERALELAEASGSGYAVGCARQSLMTLAALGGENAQALDHGWAAVEGFDTLRDRLRALVTLGGFLLEVGEGALADRAYAAALEWVEEPYYRLFALDGHAHAAALQGDREAYLERSARLEAEDWRPGGPDFAGQVHLYRGRAWLRLGDRERARESLERALEWSETHGLAATLFAAQKELDALDAVESDRAPEVLEPSAAEILARRLDRVGSALAAVS